jgi:hypothetical protein
LTPLILFFTGRLSRLDRPTVGKRPKKRRRQYVKTTASEPARVKAKGTLNKRNLGKLAQLVDMPLDVFFEAHLFWSRRYIPDADAALLQITAHLDPLDILHLSRISKHFRSTFGSKNSRHIWIAARRNVAMPGCPLDLTEPQYASLMFEQTCQVGCILSPRSKYILT